MRHLSAYITEPCYPSGCSDEVVHTDYRKCVIILLLHVVSNLPDLVIITGNLLTGEGAAGAVGGGQEIWDSLYGVVNYQRASACNHTI